ncbi:MAG: hypothetical protein ABSA29_06240 [Terriglobales bacterium]|jgi:hypothetical protein
MKTLGLLLLTLVFVAVLSQPLVAQADDETADVPSSNQLHVHPVPHHFFQMSGHGVKPWPIIPFDGLRLWGTETYWAILNPADGVYDWTALDQWLNAAQEHGTTHLMYTMALTPQWASSNPGDTTCKNGPGACDPPNDLNADGTGTDQHWKDFVRAIAIHAGNQIDTWEVWNEPAMPYYWTGTFAQMTRLAQDARSVILSVNPNAQLVSPPNGAQDPWVLHWWEGYAAAGGLQYADIAAVHGGPHSACGSPPQAAEFITIVQNLRAILKTYNQGKPIWDTEANWGNVTKDCFTDEDLQAAFLAQFYFFHRTMHVTRFYWYSYADPDVGKLFNLETGQLTKAGVAYEQVYDWMLEKTLTGCSANNTIWTCHFFGSQGYEAEAVWDTGESCSGGSCQTEDYAADKKYTHYRTLAGETVAISNNEVPIGAKPILLVK